MHLAPNPPTQGGQGTEKRHVTAKEALGAPDSEDFPDIFDHVVAMERKESQPELAARPSSPHADASYELSKSDHDQDSDGSCVRKKRAVFDEYLHKETSNVREMMACLQCRARRILCIPNRLDSTNPRAACEPCLKRWKRTESFHIVPDPCTRPWLDIQKQSFPAINTALVEVRRSVASIGATNAQTSSVTQSIPDADSLRTGLSDPASNRDSELVPMKCGAPGCTKEFRRRCDLDKHTKNHTRPLKCSVPTCKHHIIGFAEHKDRQRHYKHKHKADFKQHMDGKASASGSPVENGTEFGFLGPHSSTQCDEPDRDGVPAWDKALADSLDDWKRHSFKMMSSETHPISGNVGGVGLTDLPEYCAHTDSGYASVGRVAEPQGKEDVEDSATVYSVANSISRDEMEMYTSLFAEALADFVSSETQGAGKDWVLVRAIGASLPELLRAFSLRLGCAGSSNVEREVMYFIHKHRVDIASRFESALIPDTQASDCGSSGKPREKTDLSAVHSFIRGWLDGLADEGEHHDLALPTLDMDEGCDILSEAGEPSDQTLLPNRHDYTRIVFQSVAYRWLTASLKKELLLAPVPSQRHLSGRVYFEVVRHLEGGRKIVSSKRPSDMHTLKLRVVDWDPKAFLRAEFGTSQESLGQLLRKTITLTGSATDAQALPCERYLRQTWPVSGPGVLALLARALDSDGEAEAILPDTTQVKLDLKLWLGVEVRGTSHSIAEVAEQIAWLGAALRTSRISGAEESLSLCSPIIHISPGSHGDSPPTHILAFQTTLIPNDVGATKTGQCWHRLFRDPCTAEGYPIPRRSKYDTGLEIPLTIMARLAQSPRIHH
ncbi:hypothetical protein B0I37DRAFT_201108 [Chaetomium sp. MPI-CAGE-AT-0009]|nr:hypothetical protein B0I37DRAFT_201108 [Chaetomium sp. MPI-CAGE-AT-0009]